MSGFGAKIGMMVLQKGGGWLVNKGVTKVQDDLRTGVTNTFFKYLTGVPQGSSGDLTGDVDYRGRKHFDWESTRATGGGFWANVAHRGHFVDGETLNTMLAQQQDNPEFQGDRITLDDFKKLLDKLPEDGKVPENKGMVRLIKKDGKLVLDKVGSWGLGGVFVNFRCNMDAEHNRQVRALFVDSVMKDMQAIFPSTSNGAGVIGASMLLAASGMSQKMDAVYSKLKNLLSTEVKVIPKGAGGNDVTQAKVLAQKLMRKDVADVVNEFNKIFDETGVRNVFNALVEDACGVLGIKDDEGGSSKVEKFLDIYGAQISEAFGKSYDEKIAELAELKSGKALGAAMGKMADVLQQLCRKEVIAQEIMKVKQSEQGVKFEKDSTAYAALQAELKTEARGIYAEMGENAPKDVAELVTVRFMDEIMPYMLQKCVQDTTYRESFSREKITEALGEYIRNLGGIRENNAGPAAKNHQVIEATLIAEKGNAERRLEELGGVLENLRKSGKGNDSQEVIDVRLQQIDCHGEIQKFTRSLALMNAVKSGNVAQIDGSSRIAKWLKGLDEAQRGELNRYLDEGFSSTNKEVFAKWLEHQWAEKFFGVKLPLREDFRKIQTAALNTFEEQFMQALAANTVREGEEGLNEFIGKIGDMLMDSKFAKRIGGSKLEKVNEKKQGVEGGDVVGGQRNTVVEGLVESFVKAAIKVKIDGNEQLEAFRTTAEARSRQIADKLKTVCDRLMSEWGDRILNQFDRSLKSYFNAGLLRLREVEDQMDGFRRDLAKEIGEKLLKTFTASLADLVTIKDDKAFGKALESRLNEYAGRAQRACEEKANAIVYGLLGFTLDDREIAPEQSQKARLENAELVGRGLAQVEKEFADLADFQGQSQVFSSDELKREFGGVGKNLWMDIVVRNAPGRGSVFGEFVSAFAKRKKEEIKLSIFQKIEKKEAQVPKFILKLIDFDNWKIVKDVKGLFVEDLVPATVDAEWVKKLQRIYGLEMAARLDSYQNFEQKFLAACDLRIEARLKALQSGDGGKLLGGLSAEALAALAKDVRARVGQDAVKQALKGSLASADIDDSDAAIDDLMNRALGGLEDKAIMTALEDIQSKKGEEIRKLLDQDTNFTDRIESSLLNAVRDMKGRSENDPVMLALSLPNGFYREFAKWMSGHVKLQLTDNALTIYNHLTQETNEFYDTNALEEQVKRAVRSLEKKFSGLMKPLLESVDGYVGSFDKDLHGYAMVAVKTVLGTGDNRPSLPLKLEEQQDLEACFKVFADRFAQLRECDAGILRDAQAEIGKTLAAKKAEFEQQAGRWYDASSQEFGEWKNHFFELLDKKATERIGRALCDIQSSLVPGKNRETKAVADAIGEAKDMIRFEYDTLLDGRFERLERVQNRVGGYLRSGPSREAMLARLRERITANGNLLQEAASLRTTFENWNSWFAGERLQRALDYVLKTDCSDVPKMADELDFDQFDDSADNYVLEAVMKCLDEKDGALRGGINAVFDAYHAALKQNRVEKFGRWELTPPTGDMRKALLDILDRALPLDGKPAKDFRKVVDDYVSRMQEVADGALKKLHGAVQEEYTGLLVAAEQKFGITLQSQKAPGELVDMLKEHCAKLYVDYVNWAVGELINGRPLEETSRKLLEHCKFDFDNVYEDFLRFEGETNMVMTPMAMAKLTGLGEDSDMVKALLKDDVVHGLVGYVQKQVFANILAGYDAVMPESIRYGLLGLERRVQNAIRPLGGQPAEPGSRVVGERWIAPGSPLWSKIPNRKVYLQQAAAAAAAGAPRTLVNEDDKKDLHDLIDATRKTLERTYGEFFRKHGDFVDVALQDPNQAPGANGHSLFTNFLVMNRELDSSLKTSSTSNKSIEQVLEMHAKLMRRATKSGKLKKELGAMAANRAELKAFWQPFAGRMDKVLGIDDPANVRMPITQEGNDFRFLVTDAEIRRLASDVSCSADDFTESIAFVNGRQNPKLAELIRKVVQDILAMNEALKEIKK